MSETIEDKCIKKGVKLTEQRKIIAKVMGQSKKVYGESDHPDVDELYNRVIKIDPKFFRPAEVNYLLGDPGKACEKLGWKPTTTLEELVSEMIEKDLVEAAHEKSKESYIEPC